MSEVFEGYERQYTEISASLARKYHAASALHGGEKKQKLSEIQSGVQEAETLIRKMDLEARSLQPSVKAGLLAKIREYKSDLNNTKSELKKMSASNASVAREELLESGMADELTASSDQRGRLIMTSEKLNRSTERIRESQRTVMETEGIGITVLENLNGQRQALLDAHKKLHGVDEHISNTKKILVAMSRRMDRNKWIVGGIIAALVLAIFLILYFKFAH